MNMRIKIVESDGNCMFRAIGDQVYGDEETHTIIRQKCLDYIFFEKEFFSQFIVGDVDEYIKRKREDGVWGDDVEIQAMSELYNRPIEIYAYAKEPLRTFHEVSNDQHVKPIRLSYHGRSHYNSVRFQFLQVDNSWESRRG